jgi:hypothetical protein
LDDLKATLANLNGTAYFEGIYPGYTESYRYPVKLNEE